MHLNLLLCANVFFLLFTYTMSECEIKENIGCQFTIICDQRVNNVEVPVCRRQPHVTFIITSSSVNPLTAEFFSTTNFDYLVRIIIAINNEWNTINSRTFMYYPKALEMDLSNNRIVNIKNEAFQNLATLKSLNLSSNHIRNLYHKSFLITENKENKLELLDLSRNKLNDLTSDIFSYVPNLKTLYLQFNQIDSITNCFLNATKLRYLNLRHNLISSLNLTLVNMKSLRKLDISYNRLTKLVKSELNRVLSLEMLNASHNQISFLERGCFKHAYNLTVVDLSYNKISTPIESTLFLYNNKLQYLDLFQNKITIIQDNAFKYNKLNYLNLQNNNLTGELVSKILEGLENVTRLSLSHQSLTAIRPNTFTNMLNLAYLNLSHNNFRFIDNFSFFEVNSLNILDLSHNKLTTVIFLKNMLLNLTELYLQNNELVRIPKYTFNNMTKLRKLDISNNWIRFIEPLALPLKKLHYINIKNNRLSGVLKNRVFSPARYLRNLDLSNLELLKIDKSAFINLPELTHLNISHNEIDSIDVVNFIGIDNLNVLDISHNKLSRFHLFNSTLVSLKHLYLNNNELTMISKTLLNMTSLVYVDFSYNYITKLAEAPFSRFYELKVLRLAYNNIESFNNPETNALFELTSLTVTGNKISQINLSFFRNLVVADLSFNSITFFNSSFVDNLKSLQFLYLNFNNITEILPGTFQNLTDLKLINISHNQLKTLHYGSFSGLQKIVILDLSYNNISNVDVYAFHDINELKKLVIDNNFLKSIDVPSLSIILPSLKTLSIGGNPIPCKEIVQHIKHLNKTSVIVPLQVTSLHKIYDEDNVNGIKCGEPSAITNVYDNIVKNVDALVKVSSSVKTSSIRPICSDVVVAICDMTISAKYDTPSSIISLCNSCDRPFEYSERITNLKDKFKTYLSR